MIKESFHTHTYYCDGKNSPEEMVKGAIDKGFSAIGFSGHAFIKDFECSWAMTKENTLKYLQEIDILKEKYNNIINIYKGTELDYFCTEYPGEYDFTIGSVHYNNKNNDFSDIDNTAEIQINSANKYYNGSLVDYAADYFKLVGDVLNKTGADIIGHFDLVTKFNENDVLFDTSNKIYTDAWHNAVDELLPYNKPFEINTGAIARKVRKTPYPALNIAEYIHSKGGYFILTSDCHNYNYLDCFYKEAEKMYSKFNIISFDEYLRNK